MQLRPTAWEDLLEEEMVTHPTILPGKFPGQRSLMGCSPWVAKSRMPLSVWVHTQTMWLAESSLSNKFFKHYSVQFSHSVMSESLWPHGLLHARPSCLSPSPGASSNSCPLCRWCHPTISFSVINFSSHLQSFPASGSFLMFWFFESDGQSIGVSASASVLPMNIQDWFPLG